MPRFRTFSRLLQRKKSKPKVGRQKSASHDVIGNVSGNTRHKMMSSLHTIDLTHNALERHHVHAHDSSANDEVIRNTSHGIELITQSNTNDISIVPTNNIAVNTDASLAVNSNDTLVFTAEVDFGDNGNDSGNDNQVVTDIDSVNESEYSERSVHFPSRCNTSASALLVGLMRSPSFRECNHNGQRPPSPTHENSNAAIVFGGVRSPVMSLRERVTADDLAMAVSLLPRAPSPTMQDVSIVANNGVLAHIEESEHVPSPTQVSAMAELVERPRAERISSLFEGTVAAIAEIEHCITPMHSNVTVVSQSHATQTTETTQNSQSSQTMTAQTSKSLTTLGLDMNAMSFTAQRQAKERKNDDIKYHSRLKYLETVVDTLVDTNNTLMQGFQQFIVEYQQNSHSSTVPVMNSSGNVYSENGSSYSEKRVNKRREFDAMLKMKQSFQDYAQTAQELQNEIEDTKREKDMAHSLSFKAKPIVKSGSNGSNGRETVYDRGIAYQKKTQGKIDSMRRDKEQQQQSQSSLSRPSISLMSQHRLSL